MHGKNAKNGTICTVPFPVHLSVFAFSCRFGLLLALDAGLFIMLALTQFCLNAASEVGSLKSAESAVDAFVLLDMDLGHLFFTPLFEAIAFALLTATIRL